MIGNSPSPDSRSSDANVTLWAGGAATAAIGVMMSGTLQIFGLVLSGVILVAILWNILGKDWVRKKRMERPYSAYFRSPKQPASGPKPRETTVKAHSTEKVQINRDISITHREYILVMGFEGDESQRPKIISLENQFIVKGMAKYGSPEKNENQVITDKDRYHIKGEEFRVKGNTATVGIVVETSEPGRYQMYIRTITETGEGRPKDPLTLIVRG